MSDQEQDLILSDNESTSVQNENVQSGGLQDDNIDEVEQELKQLEKKERKNKLDPNEARRRNLAKGRQRKAEKKKQKQQTKIVDLDDDVSESDTDTDSEEELIIRKKEKKQKPQYNMPVYQAPQFDPYLALQQEVQQLKKKLEKKEKKQRKSSTQIIVNPSVQTPIVEDPASKHLRESIFGFSR